MLQKGVSDAGHQCMPVQSGPGPALEVPEPQLPLELLMRLLAGPACLGCAGRWTATCRIYVLYQKRRLHPGKLASCGLQIIFIKDIDVISKR